MFLVNPKKATLYQYNRNFSDYYDDEDIQAVQIDVCPYNADIQVKFGTYTHPEAIGYYIVKRTTDVKEGDQIEFMNGKRFTILEVRDNWLWNRIESFTIAVGDRR